MRQVKNIFMWFIRFAVFQVHEYCFHAYILKLIVQSHFILFSTKDSLLFILNLISCFKLSSTSFDQSKSEQNLLGFLITIMLSSIIIMTWLNCGKKFWWFCCAYTTDTVFIWFYVLICMNCFQFLFVLVILEV